MADFQNAGYRLLSFKYTPPLAVKEQAADNDKIFSTSKIWPGAVDLPSLSSLLTSLQEIEGLNHAGSKCSSSQGLRDEGEEGKQNAPKITPLKKFHLFKELPTEIRLKIWDLTFLPRVVEVRPPRPNYSQGQWQSGCNNPAALAVCVEAREAALVHFRIAFPLAVVANIPLTGTTQQKLPKSIPFQPTASSYTGVPFSGTPGSTENGGQARRTLYISPDHDTVCLLGQDWDDEKLTHVIQALLEADPLGVGIGRLGTTVRAWSFGGSVVRMKRLGTTLFQDLDQLVLFMYGEQHPPPRLRAKGNALADGEEREQYRREGYRCDLIPCELGNASKAYTVWSGVYGRQFREDGKVLHIGRKSKEIQFMDLEFKPGW